MSWRGLSNRRMSPTSPTTPAATARATPRSACKASTTGPSDQSGTRAAIWRSMSCLRSTAWSMGIEVGLEGDLLGRMVKALIAEPYTVCPFPDGSDVAATIAQEEAPNALARLSHVFDRNLAGPNEITHGLVGLIGNPHAREFSGAGEACQHDRVASVGLDAISGTPRGMGRGDDLTDMTGCVDLTIQPISAWASF